MLCRIEWMVLFDVRTQFLCPSPIISFLSFFSFFWGGGPFLDPQHKKSAIKTNTEWGSAQQAKTHCLLTKVCIVPHQKDGSFLQTWGQVRQRDADAEEEQEKGRGARCGHSLEPHLEGSSAQRPGHATGMAWLPHTRHWGLPCEKNKQMWVEYRVVRREGGGVGFSAHLVACSCRFTTSFSEVAQSSGDRAKERAQSASTSDDETPRSAQTSSSAATKQTNKQASESPPSSHPCLDTTKEEKVDKTSSLTIPQLVQQTALGDSEGLSGQISLQQAALELEQLVHTVQHGCAPTQQNRGTRKHN